MSEATKPVEEPVVAPEAPIEAAPAETAPAETTEAATEAPAASEPATTEETPAVSPVKEEVKPVEEGTLGYKGPGLLKSFIFQKKFFWFGTEPIEHKSLTSYLRGEKAQDLANKNAAWSSYTGKGLLYFAKKPTEKASPAGIINLSEITDVTPESPNEFHFSHGGHKHTFQTSNLIERNSWLETLKTKIEEAKELVSSVTESEEYKKSHGELTKPIVAVAPKKSVEVKDEKKEEKAEAKEEKKEEKAEKKEEKKEIKEEKKERTKSRSASRKRNSIFGSFGLGKKDEKPEVAKEETPVAPAVEEPVPTEPVAATSPETTEPAPAVEETVPAAPVEPKPTATKRNSIFGSLKSQFANKNEKKHEAPVVPPKDAEPVSETAPVIPAPEATEPLATEVAPTTEAPATETPVTNGESKVPEVPVTKSDKRKSSLPWLTKKEKSATSDEEAEKPKSPFAKLRNTIKSKTSPKAKEEKPADADNDAKEETTTATEPTPAAVEEPVVSEPTPVIQSTTAPVAASA